MNKITLYLSIFFLLFFYQANAQLIINNNQAGVYDTDPTKIEIIPPAGGSTVISALSTANSTLQIAPTSGVATTYASSVNQGGSSSTPPTPDYTKVVGTLLDNQSVNLNGSSNYSIPIPLPPGTHDMAPKLSLQYNSDVGEDIMGMGWSFNLSSIVRVNKDKYQDGICKSITLDNTDGLALDGNRMYTTSTNFSSGCVYRLEDENFTRITYSTTSGGVNYFLAETKQGIKMEYGSTVNSKLRFGTGTTKYDYEYFLSKVYDNFGNYITYTYNNDVTNYEVTLKQIDYTANDAATISSYNSVKFYYDTKDVDNNDTKYVEGYQMVKTQLLNEIDVTCGVSYIKKYNFTYGANEHHNYLTQIDYTDYDGNKLNPTVFDYGNPTGTINTALTSYYSQNASNLVNTFGPAFLTTGTDLYTGDFDGDGKTDILTFGYHFSSAGILDGNNHLTKTYTGENYSINLSTGLGFFTSGTSTPLPSGFQAYYPSDLTNFYPTDYNYTSNPREFGSTLRDFNGDGKTDMAVATTRTTGQGLDVTIYYGAGSAFTVGTKVCSLNTWEKITFGDIDGDGQVEGIIYSDPSAPSLYQNSNIKVFNFQTGNTTQPILITTNTSVTPSLDLTATIPYTGLSARDVDGDGKEELYAVWNGFPYYIQLTAQPQSGFSFSATAIWQDPTPVGATIIHEDYYGDFNGDGISDFARTLQIPPSAAQASPRTSLHYGLGGDQGMAVGGGVPLFTGSDLTSLTIKYMVADINGDHKSDLIEIVSNYCNGTLTNPGGIDIYYWDSDKVGTKIYLGNIANVLSVFNYNLSDENQDYDMDGAPGVPDASKLVHLPCFLTGDFNGDGRDDIMLRIGNSGFNQVDNQGCTNSNQDLYMVFSYDPESTEHLLTKIYDGYNRPTSFTYGSIAMNGSSIFNFGSTFYTSSTTAPTFPLSKFDTPYWLVTEMDIPDGIGGTNQELYTYVGGATHRQGKGFIGFDQMVSTNLVSNIKSTATYTTNTAYFERFPKSIVNVLATSPSTAVSTTTYSYSTLAPTGSSGNGHFSFLQSQKTIENGTTGFVTQNSYTYAVSNAATTTDGNLTNMVSTYAANSSPTTIIETTTVSTSAYNAPNTTTNDTWIQTWPLDITTTTQRGSLTAYQRKLNYTYTPQGEKLTEIQDQGSTGYVETDYAYDPTGVLTQKTTTAPTGGTSSVALPVKTYSYEYDGVKRFITKTTNPLNQISQSNFDERFGSLKYTKDITNLETNYTYDGEGRLIKKVTPDNITTNISYDWVTSAITATGEPITTYPSYILHSSYVTTTGKPSVTTYYDMFDREINTRIDGYATSQLICTAKIYDTFGHVLEQTSPYNKGTTNVLNGLVTTKTFDQFQRPLTSSTTYAGNTSTPNLTSYAYSIDASGNYKTAITMPDTKTNSTFIDPSNLLVKTIDGAGDIVNYNYISNRKIGTTTLGSSGTVQTEQITYDAYARPYQLTEPNSGITTYFYNAYGLLESTTDARGSNYNIKNTYDVLDRITSKVSPDGTFTYQYVQSGNGLNLLQTETAPSVSYGYTYDNLNRLIQKTDIITGNQYTTSFEYDQYNNLIQLTYPGGFAITQDYTSASYLKDIKRADDGTSIWQAVDMLPFGQYDQYKLCNNAITVVSYNSFDMPTQYNSGSIFNYGLVPDVTNGNITSRSDINKGITETFSYDDAYRLLTSTISSDVTTVAYDGNGNGNITSKTANSTDGSNLGTYAYQSSQINQLNTVENLDLSISANIQTVTYNTFSKLTTLVEGNYTYGITYGPDMQRVQSLVTNTSTNAQYKRDYVPSYEKTTGTNNFSREISYINAPNGLCAMYVKNGTDDTLYLVYTDHLGSILKLTDVNGVTIGEQSFDAWGRYRNINDWTYTNPQIISSLSPRGFTGHEHLPQFDLINMNGRVYDSKLGLFLSVDPLLDKTPGVSPYHYAMNNPLKFTDPTGTTGQSTHTDNLGNVLAVYDDGDLGVYKHKDAKTKADIDKVYNNKTSTSAGGEKMGETTFWDQFIKPENGQIRGKIEFGTSWESAITNLHNQAMKMDLKEIGNNSTGNKMFDIKTNIYLAPDGPMTGRLLDDKYATARDVGNYLAGWNGRTGTLYGMHLNEPSYMKIAGALNVGQYKGMQTALDVIFGAVSYGPAPYYGEDAYSGRMILQGWNSNRK
jgi:RHS repeat-associated protein